MSNPNFKISIKKLDKDRYVLLSTGEILNCSHITSRYEGINALTVTLKKLRDLINNNFSGASNEKLFTITYKENMLDTKKLYKDFEKFIKKARYKLGYFDYLSIPEPQGRGSWHCHILMKFIKDMGFIENKTIRELWGHGFVNVKAIKNVDNLGAYLSAYLANIEYKNENIKELWDKGLDINNLNIIEKNINGKSKKFIKGGRLYLYPPKINMFRKSKGIIYPEKEKGIYKELKKKHNLNDATYRRKIDICKDDKSLVTSNIYEQYNLKVL